VGALLDRPARTAPVRHATIDDMDDLPGAVALQQAGSDG
jgi:hypothetical protein